MNSSVETSELEEAARLAGSHQCPFAPAAIDGVTDVSAKDIEVDLRVEHRFVFQLRWDGPWHGTREGWEIERDDAADEARAIVVVSKEVGRRWVDLGMERSRKQLACGFAGGGIHPVKLREVVSNEECPNCGGSGRIMETETDTDMHGHFTTETVFVSCPDCDATGEHYYVGTIALESRPTPTVTLVLDDDARFYTLLPDTTNKWWAALGAEEQWDVKELTEGTLAFQARCALTFDSAVVCFKDSDARGLVGVLNDDRITTDDSFKKIMAESDEREARRALPEVGAFLAVWSVDARARCAQFSSMLERALWFRRTALSTNKGAFDGVIESAWWVISVRSRLVWQTTMFYLAAGILLAALFFESLLVAHEGPNLTDQDLAYIYDHGATDFSIALAVAAVVALAHGMYRSTLKHSVRRWRRPSYLLGPLALVVPSLLAFAAWMQVGGIPITSVSAHRDQVIASCNMVQPSNACLAFTRVNN